MLMLVKVKTQVLTINHSWVLLLAASITNRSSSTLQRTPTSVIYIHLSLEKRHPKQRRIRIRTVFMGLKNKTGFPCILLNSWVPNRLKLFPLDNIDLPSAALALSKDNQRYLCHPKNQSFCLSGKTFTKTYSKE